MTAKNFIMTENTQPRYYVLRPMSEKPENYDWYHMYVVQPNTYAIPITRWWGDSEGGWQDVPEGYTHYLSPVTEDELRVLSKEQYAWKWIQQLNHEKAEHLKEKDELVKEVERLKELLRGQTYSIWKGCNSELPFDQWRIKFFDNNQL